MTISVNSAKDVHSDKFSHVTEREPAVAGQFYPADSSKLRRALHYFFEDAVPPTVQKPIGVIVPHAGYVFSGQIAADAFNQARNHKYDLVVLLGTNHTTPGFRRVSIYPRGGYRTPLGLAEIDEEVADTLIESGEDYTYNPAVHAQEHSVEVLVPFVQHLFPGTKIVPVVIGAPDLELCKNFAQGLAKVLKERHALIVASSDLSHYPVYDAAVDVDKQTLEAIVSLDLSQLRSVMRTQMRQNIANLLTCACGEGPILTAIAAAKALGANCGTIISYANSGDTSLGQLDRVVGYGAIALTVDKNCKNWLKVPQTLPRSQSYLLQDSHKKELLTFARKTIYQFLTAETVPLARDFGPVLRSKQGVFVTLNKGGKLRGCVGCVEDALPLCQAVGCMALNCALNDRRFDPVALDELSEIEIEISVLRPFQRVNNINNIVLGRDGVVLKKDNHHAVLLPKVGIEMGWDRYTLLDHLCIKAGLPPKSWKQDTELFTFQADVFDESEFRSNCVPAQN